MKSSRASTRRDKTNSGSRSFKVRIGKLSTDAELHRRTWLCL